LNGGFGLRNLLALDRVDPKREKASKSLAGRADADVCLHEGSITRKIENGIAGKVVRLKPIEIQELTKKSEAGRPKPRSK
jgi:hypothetical protein